MEFKINSLESLDNGAVIKVGWTAKKGKGEYSGLSAFDPADPADPNFIPFEELTNDIVASWVKAEFVAHNQLDKLEAYLDKLNAKAVSKVIPWANEGTPSDFSDAPV